MPRETNNQGFLRDKDYPESYPISYTLHSPQQLHNPLRIIRPARFNFPFSVEGTEYDYSDPRYGGLTGIPLDFNLKPNLILEEAGEKTHRIKTRLRMKLRMKKKTGIQKPVVTIPLTKNKKAKKDIEETTQATWLDHLVQWWIGNAVIDTPYQAFMVVLVRLAYLLNNFHSMSRPFMQGALVHTEKQPSSGHTAGPLNLATTNSTVPNSSNEIFVFDNLTDFQQAFRVEQQPSPLPPSHRSLRSIRVSTDTTQTISKFKKTLEATSTRHLFSAHLRGVKQKNISPLSATTPASLARRSLRGTRGKQVESRKDISSVANQFVASTTRTARATVVTSPDQLNNPASTHHLRGAEHLETRLIPTPLNKLAHVETAETNSTQALTQTASTHNKTTDLITQKPYTLRRLESAPVIVTPLSDVTVHGLAPTIVQFPKNTFDSVRYSATASLSNGGSLPSWMGYWGYNGTTLYDTNFDAYTSAPTSIAWVGNYGYGATQSSSLAVINAPQATQPQIVTSISISNSVIQRVASDGNNLLLLGGTLSGNPSLIIGRLTSPTAFQQLATYSVDANPLGLFWINNTAIVQTSSSLYALNITTASSPTNIAQVLTSTTRSSAINNLLAAVVQANSISFVQLFSLPYLNTLGSITTSSTSAVDVAISEDSKTLYVADGFSGLLTVDVSDSARPVVIGGYNPSSIGKALTYNNGVVYFYGWDNSAALKAQVYLFDVANPKQPKYMAEYDVVYLSSTWERDYVIFVRNNRLFIATNNVAGSKHLYAFDPGINGNLMTYGQLIINAPMSVREQSFTIAVKATNTAGSTSTTFTLSVKGLPPTIKIPAAAIQTLSLASVNQPYDLVSAIVPNNPPDRLAATLIYDKPIVAGLNFSSISYAPKQVYSGNVTTITRLSLDNTRTLVALNWNGYGISLLNNSAGFIAGILASKNFPPDNLLLPQILFDGEDYLYRNATGPVRLRVNGTTFSVINSVNSTTQGEIGFLNKTTTRALYYANSYNAGFSTVTILNADTFSVIGSKTGVPGARRAIVNENATALVLADSYLNVYEISVDGLSLTLASQIDITTLPYCVFFVGNYLFVCNRITGLAIYNTKDLNNVFTVGSFTTTSALTQVAIPNEYPNRGYLVVGPDGVQIVDLSDLSNIRYRSSISPPAGGTARSVAVRGNEVWVAVEGFGILYYKESNWEATHLLSGTIPAAMHGSYLMNVLVTDPLHYAVTYPTTLISGNRNPIVNQTAAALIANETFGTNQPFTTPALATHLFTDPDGDEPLTLTAGVADTNGNLQLPPYLTFYPSTGQITGSFPSSVRGLFPITIRTLDGYGGFADVIKYLNNPNLPPASARGYANTTVTAGTNIIPATGVWSDANQDVMTFNGSALDPGITVSVDSSSGEVTVSTVPHGQGLNRYQVDATDSYGAVTRTTGYITYKNTPPAAATELIPDGEVGTPFNFTLATPSDLDEDDIDDSVLGPARISYNSTTRQLSGTPDAGLIGVNVLSRALNDPYSSTQLSYVWLVKDPMQISLGNSTLSYTQNQERNIGQEVNVGISGSKKVPRSFTLRITNTAAGSGILTINDTAGVNINHSQQDVLILQGLPEDLSAACQKLDFKPTQYFAQQVGLTFLLTDDAGFSPSKQATTTLLPVRVPNPMTLVANSTTTQLNLTPLTTASGNLPSVKNYDGDNVKFNVTMRNANNTAASDFTVQTSVVQISTQQDGIVYGGTYTVNAPASSQGFYSVSITAEAYSKATGALLSSKSLSVAATPITVSSPTISVPPAVLANIGVGNATNFTLPTVSISGDTVYDRITNLPEGWNYDANTCLVTANAQDAASITLIREVCAAHEATYCVTQTYTVVAVPTLSAANTNVTQMDQDSSIALTGLSVNTPANSVSFTLSTDATKASFSVNTNTAGVSVTQSTGQVIFTGAPDALNTYFQATPPLLVGSQTNRLALIVSSSAQDAFGQISSSSKQIAVNPINHPLTASSILPTVASTVPTQATSVIVSTTNLYNIDNVLWKLASVNVSRNGTVVASETNLNGWNFSGINGSPSNQQAQLSLTPPAGSQGSYALTLGIQAVDNVGNPLPGMPLLNLNTASFAVTSGNILVPPAVLANIGVGNTTSFSLPTVSINGDTVNDQITNLPEGWSYDANTCIVTATAQNAGSITLIRQVCAAHDASACAIQTYTLVAVPTLSAVNTDITEMDQDSSIALTGLSVNTPANSVSFTLSTDATKASFSVNTNTAGVSVTQSTGQVIFTGSPDALNTYFQATPPLLVGSQTNRLALIVSTAAQDAFGQISSSSKQIAVNPVNHPLTSSDILPHIGSTISTQATSVTISSTHINNIDGVLWTIVEANITNSDGQVIANATNLNGWTLSGLNGTPSNQQAQLSIIPPAGSQGSYGLSLGIQAVDNNGNPLSGMPVLNLSTSGFAVTSAAISVSPAVLANIKVGNTTSFTLPEASTTGDSLIDTIIDPPVIYDPITRQVTITAHTAGPMTLIRKVCAAHDSKQCAIQTYALVAEPSLSASSTAITQFNQSSTVSLTGLSVQTFADSVSFTLSVNDPTRADFKVNTSTADVSVSQSVGLVTFVGTVSALNDYFVATPPQLMGSETNRYAITLTTDVRDSLEQITASSQQINIIPVNHPLTASGIVPSLSNVYPTQTTSVTLSAVHLNNVDNVLWQVRHIQVYNNGTIMANESNSNGWSFSGLNGAPTNQQTQISLIPPRGSQGIYRLGLVLQPVDNNGNALVGMPTFELETSTFAVVSAPIIVPAQSLAAAGVGETQIYVLDAPSTADGSTLTEELIGLPTGWTYDAATRTLIAHPLSSQVGPITLIRRVSNGYDVTTQAYTVTVTATMSVQIGNQTLSYVENQVKTDAGQIANIQISGTNPVTVYLSISGNAAISVQPIAGVSIDSTSQAHTWILTGSAADVTEALRSMSVDAGAYNNQPFTVNILVIDRVNTPYTNSLSFLGTAVQNPLSILTQQNGTTILSTPLQSSAGSLPTFVDYDGNNLYISAKVLDVNGTDVTALFTFQINALPPVGTNYGGTYTLIPRNGLQGIHGEQSYSLVFTAQAYSGNSPIANKSIQSEAIPLVVRNAAPIVTGTTNDQVVLMNHPFAVLLAPVSSPVGDRLHATLTTATGKAAPAWLSLSEISPGQFVLQGTAPAGATTEKLIVIYSDEHGGQTRSNVIQMSAENALVVSNTAATDVFQQNAAGTNATLVSRPADYQNNVNITLTKLIPQQLGKPVVTTNLNAAVPTISFDASTGSWKWVCTGSKAEVNEQQAHIELELTENYFGGGTIITTYDNQLDPPVTIYTNYNVAHLNQRPKLVFDAADIEGTAGARLQAQIQSSAFNDPDVLTAGDHLTISLRMQDGSDVPGWFGWNPATLSFNGNIPEGIQGTFDVEVCAKDSGGLEICSPFTITVNPKPQPTAAEKAEEGLTYFGYAAAIGAPTYKLGQMLRSILRRYIRQKASIKQIKKMNEDLAKLRADARYQGLLNQLQNNNVMDLDALLDAVMKDISEDVYEDKDIIQRVLDKLSGIKTTIVQHVGNDDLRAIQLLRELSTIELSAKGVLGVYAENPKMNPEDKLKERIQLAGRIETVCAQLPGLLANAPVLLLLGPDLGGLVNKLRGDNLSKKLDKLSLAMTLYLFNQPDNPPRGFEAKVFSSITTVGDILERALIEHDHDEQTIILARLIEILLGYIFNTLTAKDRKIDIEQQLKLVNQLIAGPGVSRPLWLKAYHLVKYQLLCFKVNPNKELPTELKLIIKRALATASRLRTDDSLYKMLRRIPRWVKAGGSNFAPAPILWDDELRRLAIDAIFAPHDLSKLRDIINNYMKASDEIPHVIAAYKAALEQIAKNSDVNSKRLIKNATELRPQIFRIIYHSNQQHLTEVIRQYHGLKDPAMIETYSICLNKVARLSNSAELRRLATEALQAKGAQTAHYLPKTSSCIPVGLFSCGPNKAKLKKTDSTLSEGGEEEIAFDNPMLKLQSNAQGANLVKPPANGGAGGSGVNVSPPPQRRSIFVAAPLVGAAAGTPAPSKSAMLVRRGSGDDAASANGALVYHSPLRVQRQSTVRAALAPVPTGAAGASAAPLSRANISNGH